MEPETSPVSDVSLNVPHHGRRSAPPGNALAPPAVILPTYPSSTLNNYYRPSTSFIPYEQNNARAHSSAPQVFHDLPPSACQSCVPSLRRTPSSPLRPVSSVGSSRHPTDNISYTSLSPLLFQPSSPNTHIPNHTLEPRLHAIFSPQIMNSPLPNTPYFLPARPHSARIPTPHLAPPYIAPQPVQPILPFTQTFSPLPATAYHFYSSYSHVK